MNFLRKHRGSVTILLSIILLPSLAFSGLMVDSANLQLSQSVVESSGELAASSALANYDTVLKDVYGLYAVTQDMDQLNKDISGYFSNTLQAGALLDEGAVYDSATVKKIQDELGDFLNIVNREDVNKNFLNVESASCTVSGIAGSQLSKAKILKNQIVEFMKYRGPAEVGLDLLSSVSAFTKADQKAKVADSKMDVDQAMSDLSELAQKFYSAIVDYDAKMGALKEKEKNFDENIENYNAKIREANKKLVLASSVIDLDNVPEVRKIIKKKGVYGVLVEIDYWTFEAGKSTETDYDTLVNNIRGAVNEITDPNASYNILNTTEVGNFSSWEYTDQVRIVNMYIEYVQKWKQVESEINKLEDYFTRQNHYRLTKGAGESDADFEKRVTNREDEIKELGFSVQDHLDSVYTNIQGKYQNVIETLRSSIQNAQTEFEQLINGIAKEVNAYYDVANNMSKNANTERKWYQKLFGTKKYNCIEYPILCGQKLKSAMQTFQEKNEKFLKKIDNYGAKEGKDDYYATMKSEYEKNKMIVANGGAEEVDEIISQLNAAKEYVFGKEGVLKTIDTFQFYQKPFHSDSGNIEKDMFTSGKKILKDLGDSFHMENEESYYNTYYNEKFKTNRNHYRESSYAKKISEAGVAVEGGTKNVPGFYIYLCSNYGSAPDAEDSSYKGDDNVADNLSGQSDKVMDTVGDSNVDDKGDKALKNYLTTMKAFTDAGLTESGGCETSGDKGEWGDGFTGILKQLKSMVTTFTDIFGVFGQGFEGNRDNLLVTEYVAENFSYATMEKEKEKEKGNSSPHDFQTMTNYDINSKNNVLYGCELEYIVGGYKGSAEETSGWWIFSKTKAASGPEKNVNVVKGKIYAIRFVMNSIVALSNGVIDKETLPAATAISSATGGFIPVPVAQVVLKLGLALLESSHDLDELMKGEEVPVYKSNYQIWHYHFLNMGSAFLEQAANGIADKVKDKVEDHMDQFNNYIQQCLDNAEEWTNKKVSDITGGLKTSIEQCVTNSLQGALDAMTNIVSGEVEKAYYAIFTTGTAFSKEKLEASITASLNSYIDNSKYSKEIKDFLSSQISAIVPQIVNDSAIINELENIGNQISNSANSVITVTQENHKKIMDAVSAKMHGYLESAEGTIKSEVKSLTGTVVNTVKGKISNLTDKGKEMASKTIDSVSAEINTFLKSQFGDSSVKLGKESVISSASAGSVMSFSYKDYVRLFVFLELTTNSEKAVSRISDLIQMNVRLGLKDYYGKGNTPSADSRSHFEMKKAYTYVEVNAKVRTKPLLLSQKLFVRSLDVDNPLNFWGYSYQTVAGY